VIRSFEYFGGVAGEVLVDNQKSAVLEHRRQGSPRFNPRFLDLAGHYGFLPRACRPARARTKGKDERMVSYIKHHFFERYRSFESLAHLNQIAEQWLKEEADTRVHGTVREVVAARFAREAPALGATPARRYDTSYWELRQVAWDAYIEVRGNRYSVPGHLTGQRVSIRLSLDGVLSVFDGEQRVAVTCPHPSCCPVPRMRLRRVCCRLSWPRRLDFTILRGKSPSMWGCLELSLVKSRLKRSSLAGGRYR